MKKKDILDMESLSVDEIKYILNMADKMKEISGRSIKKVPTLRGKTVVLFFYEPSTRTRTSFDIAAKRLSADSISLSGSSSSIVKGETLVDTAKNIEAMNADVVVLRHPCAGAAAMLAQSLKISVINAGDGMHAHPTQALLDIMTVMEKKGRIDGLKIAIIGDIAHSRVARSDCVGFTKMGAKVVVTGPPTMIPRGIEAIGASVAKNIDDAIKDADVIMALRLQKERQGNFLFSTLREYSKAFGITTKRFESAKKDVFIMHPGPVNRGLEIAPEVADSLHSMILDQVANGVAIRMALLLLTAGGVWNVDSD